MKAINEKDTSHSKKIEMKSFVRQQFREKSESVRLLDIEKIEFLMKTGKRQLKLFKISKGFSMMDLDQQRKKS